MAQNPSENTPPSHATSQASAVGSTKGKTQPKIPTMLTHQVMIGVLNDTLSGCTFRTMPIVGEAPVPLSDPTPSTSSQYMLVVRFDKRGIAYEVLSHDYAAYVNERHINTDHRDDSKTTSLIVGFMAALKRHLTEPTPFPKVPLSILNKYLDRDINRGGLWAYMSLPTFLGDAQADTSAKKERQRKLLKSAQEGVKPIRDMSIVSLLWNLHFLMADAKLDIVCNALVREFLDWHHDPKRLVCILYMGSIMGLLIQSEISDAISAHLDSVQVLEELTENELLLLLGCLETKEAMTLGAVKKLILIFKEEVDTIQPRSAAYLLWVLYRLGYDFNEDLSFMDAIMIRLTDGFDEMLSNVRFLLNPLAFVPYDLYYYDDILNSVILKFHVMDHSDLLMIGASYALASYLRNQQEADSDDVPLSTDIHHCLGLYVRRALAPLADDRGIMRSLVPITLLEDAAYHFTDAIAEENAPFSQNGRGKLHKRPHVQSGIAGSQNIERSATEKRTALKKPSNTFKLFYLNLLEDSCIRYEQLDYPSHCYLIYALLTLHIDMSPIHQAMLVKQGLMLRKRHNPVQVTEIPLEDRSRQKKMAYELLQYSQSPTDSSAPLVIEDLEVKHITLETQSTIPSIRTEPRASAATTLTNESVTVGLINFASNDSNPAEAVLEFSGTDNVHGELESAQRATITQPQIHATQLLETLTSALSTGGANTPPSMEDFIRIYQHVLERSNVELKRDDTTKRGEEPVSEAPKKGDSAETTQETKQKVANPVNKGKPAGKKGHHSDVKNYQHETYHVMFRLRTICKHKAVLIKRKVAISYVYVKVKGVTK